MVLHWGKAVGKSRVYIYIQVFILHFRFYFCLHCYRCSFLQIWTPEPGGFLTGAQKSWEVSCSKKTICKPAKGQFLTQEKLKLINLYVEHCSLLFVRSTNSCLQCGKFKLHIFPLFTGLLQHPSASAADLSLSVRYMLKVSMQQTPGFLSDENAPWERGWLAWCIVPSLVPSFTARFDKKTQQQSKHALVKIIVMPWVLIKVARVPWCFFIYFFSAL